MIIGVTHDQDGRVVRRLSVPASAGMADQLLLDPP
jgi:hypothetical protein